MIFTQGNYPIKWTEGIISAIFKNGDPSNPENYRGITLCSNLSKLFSSIRNNRLVKFLQEHNLSSVEQIGLKKKARTADHLFVLKSILDSHLGKGKQIFACFVDFRKAFDTVWWNGLFYKILKTGIRGNFYDILKSMYIAAPLKPNLG